MGVIQQLLFAILGVLFLLAPSLTSAVAVRDAEFSQWTNAPSIPGQRPQVGNGYVATFVNNSLQYVAGVFNGEKTKSTRAGFPATSNVYFGAALDHIANESYPFHLDEDTATVSISGPCEGFKNASFLQRWYAHGKIRNLLVEDMVLYNNGPIDLVQRFTEYSTPDSMVDQVRVVSKIQRDNYTVTTYETLQPEEPSSETTFVSIAVSSLPKWTVVSGYAGRVYQRYAAHVTSLDEGVRDPKKLEEAAVRILDDAVAAGWTKLYASHLQYWENLWNHSIALNSPTAGPAIRASQYALLSAVRADWPYSTSPGGLSTDGYNGHAFWDMETWDAPNLMLLHPDIARGSTFAYRFNRLQGAMVNAKETLQIDAGAAFPWESAFTGENVCPAPLYAHTELHVTADVVNAIRMDWQLFNDKGFLSAAWPVLNETAQFWVHRTTALTQPVGEPIHLKNVTGPDEYHLGDDSGFTNYAVQLAVAFTLEAAEILNIDVSRIPNFGPMSRIATSMFIPYDAVKNYHPEYDQYNGSLVKQADTILLNYPLGMQMNESTKRNDLLYYAKRTLPNKSGASTMTWSMFAVGFNSIASFAEGIEYFYLGFQRNCFAPYWQWYQQMGGHGCDNFVTGGGGFLQSVWAGLGGLRIEPDGLLINASTVVLLPDATNLQMQGVHWRDAVMTFNYTAQPLAQSPHSKEDDLRNIQLSISVVNAEHPVCINGAKLEKRVGEAFTCTIQRSSAASSTSCDVILRIQHC